MTSLLHSIRDGNRHGISLLEVLIAVGILAIGLSSVVALIPAARSQSARAVILDRAAATAANALADAATFGLLMPSALTSPPRIGAPVMIDSIAPAPYLLTSASTTMRLSALKPQGIYSSATTSVAAPAAVHQLFTQSRDDLTYAEGQSENDPAINRFNDGTRAFEGRTSCVYCLRSGSPSGAPGTLSVVVFHARDPSALAVTGTMINSQLFVPAANLAGRELRDILRPGVVVYDVPNQRFHQASAAAVNPGDGTAFLTLSTGTLLSTGTYTVQILPDSVGLAERSYLSEGVTPFSK